jgi:hypothetical protein
MQLIKSAEVVLNKVPMKQEISKVETEIEVHNNIILDERITGEEVPGSGHITRFGKVSRPSSCLIENGC